MGEGGCLFQEVCVRCVSGWVRLFLFTIWSSVPDHSGASVCGSLMLCPDPVGMICAIFKALLA